MTHSSLTTFVSGWWLLTLLFFPSSLVWLPCASCLTTPIFYSVQESYSTHPSAHFTGRVSSGFVGWMRYDSSGSPVWFFLAEHWRRSGKGMGRERMSRALELYLGLYSSINCLQIQVLTPALGICQEAASYPECPVLSSLNYFRIKVYSRQALHH